MTTTNVRADGAAELLSYIPYLVAITPRNCLVLVAFSDHQTCGALRVGLPPQGVDADELAAGIVSALGTMMRLPGVTGVVPVVYTPARYADDGRPPLGDIVMLVIRTARADGLDVHDALCVAADGWGSYLDDDGSWTPRDLAEIRVPEGLDEAPSLLDPDEEAALPSANLRDGEQCARRYVRMCPAAWPAVMCDLDAAARSVFDDTAMRGDLVLFAEHCLAAGGEITVADAAALGALMRLPAFRDVLLYEWAWGSVTGTHILRSTLLTSRSESEARDDAWMVALIGKISVRPDVDRLRRSLTLLKRVASLLPLSERAASYTLIAWIYWALGLNSVAAPWLARVASVDSTYGLAEILSSVLAAGHMPDWAFADGDELDSDWDAFADADGLGF
ncbi:protein of unknown function [Paramicrobacterium humi]|uniref:DUF4192 domain-containing protein n=1 Tax=Paramicrobacterium humi TaxID=640635 RepID=A0A1H4PEM1_9MICO|nr:DUF4192 family protein [Microbacterium humi]SEC05896.1 protein of unknown function [Microbacterium humi]